MKPEDDERSIDWGPTNIKALWDRYRDLVKESEAIIERLDGLADEDVALASRVRKLEEGLASMSEQANVDRERVNELQAAIAEKVRSEPSAGFRELEPEFSPPIGGRIGDTEDFTWLRGTGAPARNAGIFPLGTPVRHAHGQHGLHEHTAEEYARHQRPIDDERLPGGVVWEIEELVIDAIGASAAERFKQSLMDQGYQRGRAAALDEVESRVSEAIRGVTSSRENSGS